MTPQVSVYCSNQLLSYLDMNLEFDWSNKQNSLNKMVKCMQIPRVASYIEIMHVHLSRPFHHKTTVKSYQSNRILFHLIFQNFQIFSTNFEIGNLFTAFNFRLLYPFPIPFWKLDRESKFNLIDKATWHLNQHKSLIT